MNEAKEIQKHCVISTCIAYEQGYGHGIANRKLQNPYKRGSDEFYAWKYGHDTGHDKYLATRNKFIDLGNIKI